MFLSGDMLQKAEWRLNVKLRLQAGLGSVVSQTVIDLRNTIKRFVSFFKSEKYSPDSETLCKRRLKVKLGL